MRDITICGAGGLGREIAWLIDRINQVEPLWNIIGFVDDTEHSENLGGYSIVGDTDWLVNYGGRLSVAIAVGASKTRKYLYEKIRNNKSIDFPNIIDPSVILSDRITMGKGNLICAGSVLTVDVSIANFCLINLDCTIGHDARLHDFVSLNPSVNVSGGTVLEECVEMGTGSQTIQLREVGTGTIVGAGAVVNKNLPANCTAVGVPARPIKFHNQ